MSARISAVAATAFIMAAILATSPAVQAVANGYWDTSDTLKAATCGEAQNNVDHVLICHALCPGVSVCFRPDDKNFRSINFFA